MGVIADLFAVGLIGVAVAIAITVAVAGGPCCWVLLGILVFAAAR